MGSTLYHQERLRMTCKFWTTVLVLVVGSLMAMIHEEYTRKTLLAAQQRHDQGWKATPRIRQLSILGERNSGTRWTYDHLNDCFGHGLRVVSNLTRHKHWFQYSDPSRYEHETLVIAQFRNPYDWLKAMERVPHHAPNHLRTKEGANASSNESENDWRIFLSKEWTMNRVGKDLELLGNETCQENFAFRDIISCIQEPLPRSYYQHKLRYSEQEPFYEMRNDGSGHAYANIMELRSDKILNVLSIREYPHIASVWATQYEYLLETGTGFLLERIRNVTGIEPNCQAVAPQVRPEKKTRVVTPDFARYVREHVNWTVEAMVGYEVEWARENPIE